MVAPLLGACSAERALPGSLPVDELFQNFYESLGGEERLGPAISPVVERGSLLCQYVYRAVMCYDSTRSGLGQFFLDDVGLTLQVHDDPQPYPEQYSPRVVDGYPIYPDFIPLYDALFGSLYAGRPISNPRYNYELRRIEQYFEKVGFYQNFDDVPGNAHLLEYGAYVCGDACRIEPLNAIPQASLASPFVEVLEPLGGVEVFGKPISEPYIAEDGYLEQIFENVIVYAPASNPHDFRFRPLPFMVGIPAIAPGPKIYDERQNVIFYAVDGEMGYHVPILFDEFITSHGGMVYSGKPTSDPSYFPGVETPRQCFENYCLDYYGDAGEGESRVRLAPLGIQYQEILHPGGEASTQVAFLMNEGSPEIGVSDEQTITVVVYESSSMQPVANVEARLVLTGPDGVQYSYVFPPTGSDGKASLTLPPLAGVTRGSLVLYEVCLNVPMPPPCATDAYLIWE